MGGSEWDFVVDVCCLSCLWLHRLDREREEFESFLAGLEPSGEPELAALDVDPAAVVSVGVLGFLVAFIEKHSAIGVVEVRHIRCPLLLVALEARGTKARRLARRPLACRAWRERKI